MGVQKVNKLQLSSHYIDVHQIVSGSSSQNSEKFTHFMMLNLEHEIILLTCAGNVVVLVVAVVSSVIVLVVGIAIGVYIWKQRYIQKKRRGK